MRLSNDITIVGNTMDSIADGYRESYQSDVQVGARGAMLRDSENIIFSHNKISDYRDGIVYLEVKGLTLAERMKWTGGCKALNEDVCKVFWPLSMARSLKGQKAMALLDLHK